MSCKREGFDTQLHTSRVISSLSTIDSNWLVILATVNNEASPPASPPGLLRFELLDLWSDILTDYWKSFDRDSDGWQGRCFSGDLVLCTKRSGSSDPTNRKRSPLGYPPTHLGYPPRLWSEALISECWELTPHF